VFSFLDELISTHLHVLVKQVASKHLLSVLEVDPIGGEEEESKSSLSGKMEVLIVEHYVVVVQEQKL
jgi:hypothetical protein